MKRSNFDRRGNFYRLGSLVKGATLPIQKCLSVASVFIEINDRCSGFHNYMLLRPCLYRNNLKAS